jgi:signal transduction histidine kinase
VAESITNAANHTDASGVDVRLRGLPGALQIDIQDDGRGGADCDAGTGLRGLADRVKALGGSSR